jgi:hypothetical protein
MTSTDIDEVRDFMSDVFSVDNHEVTDETPSLKTPRSYHGTRCVQDFESCVKNACKSADFLTSGCAAHLAMNAAKPFRLRSIPRDDGSSMCKIVFDGNSGMMTPSQFAPSCLLNHSKSENRRVEHPLESFPPYVALSVQYVTLYSMCLLRPSPTRCGSPISITSPASSSSSSASALARVAYPVGTRIAPTSLGVVGRGPGVRNAARSSDAAVVVVVGVVIVVVVVGRTEMTRRAVTRRRHRSPRVAVRASEVEPTGRRADAHTEARRSVRDAPRVDRKARRVEPFVVAGRGVRRPTRARAMANAGIGLSQFAFVGTFIAAVKKTIAGPREEPPEHLKCVITQELFRDPVVLVQTGYTYDRIAIQRWLAAKFPPTDPTSNVELWCTDLVPNWSLRQSVDEWGVANGYGAMDPPEEAVRVTKDGRPMGRRSANATSATALTHQYLQALHRTHPRHAAVLVFLMTFTLGTITVTTLTVVHSAYAAVGAALRHEAVARMLDGPAQSFVWWFCVGGFLFLAHCGAQDVPPVARGRERVDRRGRAQDVVGRGFFRRLGVAR